MARRVPAEYRKIVKEAKRQNWRTNEIEGGLQLLAPDGIHMVTIHFSEGRNGPRNTINRMRARGFVWEGR